MLVFADAGCWNVLQIHGTLAGLGPEPQNNTTEARKVLNRARLACPIKVRCVDPITARLEEANDTPAAN